MIGSVRFSFGSVRTSVIVVACAACVLWLTVPTSADNYIFTDRNADAYVLTKNYISYSTNATGDDILTLNQMFGGNYLWVRRAGKDSVIRDAHVIKDADRLFEALEETQSERESLREARVQLEEEESTLNTDKEVVVTRLSALDSGDRSSTARVALEGQLAVLSVKRSSLDDRASELGLQETAFETRAKSLELQVETSLWALVDRALANGLGLDSSRW